MKKKQKKKCWRCDGTGEVMPSIKNFMFLLSYIDAEPVPCPVCYPKFWKNHPFEKENVLKSL